MRVDHYECDECGRRTRRITIHKSELNAVYEDLHFCGTLCMDGFISHIAADSGAEAAEYWLKGQDLRDGA
jgi:hypothetical protein